jgi:tetratricopeptide (TPR) repeat protein
VSGAPLPRKRSMATYLAMCLALLASLALPPAADARAEPGTPVENVELRTLAGGKERLLSTKAKVNVFFFFRSSQDRSVDALRQMVQCEKDLAGKSIHWVAVVSSSDPAEDVAIIAKEAGLQMPILIDEDDRVYDKLMVRLHPMVGIADAKHVLVSLEPYRQIDYCAAVKARIQFALGELDQAALDKVLSPEKSLLPGADPMKKAMRDVNMARRLLDIGKYSESVKFAQRALLIAPVSQAFTVMGQAYAKQGKCGDASKAFDQALKLDPKDADAAAGKGRCR